MELLLLLSVLFEHWIDKVRKKVSLQTRNLCSECVAVRTGQPECNRNAKSDVLLFSSVNQ